MASTDATAITMTAACELGTHRCGGTVLSITDAHLTPCACPCHDEVQDQDEELVLDALADLALERDREHDLFGWWS